MSYGIMEYWNVGKRSKNYNSFNSITPPLHYSRFGMVTYF